MTKEKLKQEAIKYAIDYPASYGKGYKHKDLRNAYLAGAEPREKRIEELEQESNKLLDVINNQDVKIADLKKENAELRNNGFTVSAMTEQQLKVAIEKGEQLEKENTELREKNNQLTKKCDCLTNCNDGLQDLLSNDIDALEQLLEQRTKAKELLNACIFKARGNVNPSWSELITDIEQFLRETDIDNAIQKANEGLNLDKIADEVEQDIKEQKVK